MSFFRLLFAFSSTILAVAMLSSVSAAENAVIDPIAFLQKHCVDCHGATDPEGELSLHDLTTSLAADRDLVRWQKVVERVVLGEMPPEAEPRPDARQSEAFVEWITAGLKERGIDTSDIGRKLLLPGNGNRVDHAALFSANPDTPTASPRRIWRISPQIYVSFIPHIDKDANRRNLGQPFSSASGHGFKDFATLFSVDEPAIGQLLRNSKQIVDFQCSENNRRLPNQFKPLLASDAQPTDEEIRGALAHQFHLAMLRAPADDELERLVALYRENVASGDQISGTKATLQAILLHPESLYRMEFGTGQPDEHGRLMLSPRELTYAISFALTDDLPDSTLLAAADEGRLASREDVRREVERLLNDPQIEKPRIMRFFDEYFDYARLVDAFKDHLPQNLARKGNGMRALVNDTRQLIQHVLDEDRDVLQQLLTTNKAFVNFQTDPKNGARPAANFKYKGNAKERDIVQDPRLADWYNMPIDWEWTENQPLSLLADQRAGILTQPSWLAAYASNDENQPVQRGKWIRERLLGGVVPDIPIAVDAQLPNTPDQTVRQRMHVTREAYCWNCHQKMNPLGVTLEHYNYLGRYRDDEPVLDIVATEKNVDKNGKPLGPVMKGVPVDASSKISDSGDAKINGQVNNAVELMHKLADSPRVRQVFVRHAFRYWMGRNETLDDGPVLVAADNAYVENGGSMKALITSLLTSDAFIYRWQPGQMKKASAQ